VKLASHRFFRWAALIGLLATTLASAETGVTTDADKVTAHEVVGDTTRQVMEVVAEAQAAGGQVSEPYYAQLEALLNPVVDFRGFARGVMGPYATSARYRSLDEAGQEQLKDQLDRFTEKMRDVMVRTYGKGLLAFGGSRIQITPPASEAKNERLVSVEQLIFKEGAEPYTVLYQMGRDRDGNWMLRNMIIENVNLGEIYRSQFESAARKYDGDLDQVIDTWSAVDIDA
jgi:phospholipid transport system substrate-binding protein